MKIDPSIILKSREVVLAIGMLGFCIPFGLASYVRLDLCHSLSPDDTTYHNSKNGKGTGKNA